MRRGAWCAPTWSRRPGYLFRPTGAPNERSTAQPPRDFYLYFIQPYEPPAFEDRQQPDEVFFRLTGRDEAFEQALQTFAGAQEMAVVSSGEHKQARSACAKGDEAVQALQRWLRQHMPATPGVTVTHEGTPKPLAEWSREAPGPRGKLSILERQHDLPVAGGNHPATGLQGLAPAVGRAGLCRGGRQHRALVSGRGVSAGSGGSNSKL